LERALRRSASESQTAPKSALCAEAEAFLSPPVASEDFGWAARVNGARMFGMADSIGWRLEWSTDGRNPRLHHGDV